MKDNLEKQYCHHWSDEEWKSIMTRGGGSKKRYQYCTDSSGAILYLRAFQGHSGRSFIDPSFKGNVIIPDGFSQCIYHVVCAISLHSIINSGLIPGGQFEQQTDSILSACGFLWTKNIRILKRSTWKHRVLHSTCTKHGRNIKIRCIGSISTMLWRKYWSSIKHDRMQSFFTKHFQLIVFRKLFVWKLEKSYMKKHTCHLGLHQRSLWNTTGKENWVQNMLNDQKDKLCNHLEVPNRANQIQTRIMIERRNLLFALKEERTALRKSTHVLFLKKLWDPIQRRKLVVCCDANHERSILNEVDIDFRKPGLPHSVVKQADNYRVRELVKKIENHLHRQSLQRDLQQNKAYNPFSTTSKKMNQDVGNMELFESFGTDHERSAKNACHTGVKALSIEHAGISWLKVKPTDIGLSLNSKLCQKEDGKTPQKKEYHQAHNLKKRCIKKHFTGIHHCFLKDLVFRASQLEYDRDEEVCHKWDTNSIGGSLSISLETLADHWETVLTSTERCLHETVYTKNLENDNSAPRFIGSTHNGTHRRVLPPVGGNGASPGEAQNISNESPHMSDVQSDMIDKWERVRSFDKTSNKRLSRICFYCSLFFFFAIGSFTADGGLLQPTGMSRQHLKRPVFAVWISTRNSRGQNWVSGYSDKN